MRLEMRHLGCLAATALDRGGACRIGALFERTFYVDLDEVWICVGPDTLGRGPLNLGCALPGSVDWHASGLREGLDCHAGPSALRIGQLTGSRWATPKSGRRRPRRPGPSEL